MKKIKISHSEINQLALESKIDEKKFNILKHKIDPFITKIAHRFHFKIKKLEMVDVDDLIQSGYVGLIDAIKNYDINYKSKSNKFATYAYYRVFGEMADFIRRISDKKRYDILTIKKIDKILKEIEYMGIYNPTKNDLITKFNVNENDYNRYVKYRHHVTRPFLNCYLKNSGKEDEIKHRCIIDERIDLFESSNNNDISRIIKDSLSILARRERAFIFAYYYHNFKLKEIAKIFKLTKARMCQMKAEIIRKLQPALKSRIDFYN